MNSTECASKGVFCVKMSKRWVSTSLAEASAGTSKLFCSASTTVDYFYWLTDFLSRRNGCPGCHVETHDG